MPFGKFISSLFSPKVNDPLEFTQLYEPLDVLGEGGFGKVLKCRNKDTKDIVAVKIFGYNSDRKKEMKMLSFLMDHNLDQYNIVKFFGEVPWKNRGKVLVFEMLDISIHDYMKKNQFDPMCLSEVRSIMQQMAIALDALKNIGVIHSDIKTDNIMLVDHKSLPLKAKLIDFGLALPREKAKGKKLSVTDFRSPEVVLGLPTVSEATDMWSLGCAMAMMVTGDILFPAENEYQVLQRIVNFLGQPARHVLDKGRKTSEYFTKTRSKTRSKRWRLKTPEEYYGTCSPVSSSSPSLETMDDLKVFMRTTYRANRKEGEQCMELLLAMLKLDATERITPSEVLAHPFIDKNEASTSATAQGSKSLGMSQRKETEKKKVSVEHSFLGAESSPLMVCLAAAMGGLQVDNDLDRQISEYFHFELPGTALEDDDTTNIQPDHCSSSPTIPPSVAVMAQPTTAENTQGMGDQESADSLQAGLNEMTGTPALASEVEDVYCEPPATALEDDDTTNIQPDHCSSSPTIPPSVAVMVEPTTAENTQGMGDQESADSLQAGLNEMTGTLAMASEVEDVYCEPPATALEDDDTTNIQPDHCSSSPTIPPSVAVMVEPTTAENTQAMGDQESADSLQAGLNEMTGTPALASEVEDVYCEPPATALEDDDTTNIQPDHCSSSPTIPPSVAVMAQPTTAENTQAMGDQESADSLQAGLNEMTGTPALASEVEDVYCEPPATALEDDDTTNIQPDHCSSSPTIPPSVAVMVEPTTAENTQAMGDQESAESEERRVRTSVTDTDLTICDDIRTKEKKTKKKKNCFRRFGSWMKKTFCCCWTCPKED